MSSERTKAIAVAQKLADRVGAGLTSAVLATTVLTLLIDTLAESGVIDSATFQANLDAAVVRALTPLLDKDVPL